MIFESSRSSNEYSYTSFTVALRHCFLVKFSLSVIVDKKKNTIKIAKEISDGRVGADVEVAIKVRGKIAI